MLVASQLSPQARTTHLAAGPTPVDIAELLIERGAEVDAKSAAGVTALMVAAGHNNAPMIGLLLGKGANPGLRITLARRRSTLHVKLATTWPSAPCSSSPSRSRTEPERAARPAIENCTGITRLCATPPACVVAAALALPTTADAYQLFISNEKDNTVTVLDSTTMQPIKLIKTGARPRGIRITPGFQGSARLRRR